MNRSFLQAAAAALLVLSFSACSKATAAPPAPAAAPQAGPQTAPRPAGAPAAGPAAARPNQAGPRAYRDVITDKAETQDGLFKVHRLDDKLFFEIPAGEFGNEMLLMSRPVESTLQNPGGFFGGGTRIFVQWERDRNRIILRQRQHTLTADSTDAVWRAVSPFRNGAVLSTFEIQAFGADSAAVIDVSDLFL